MRIAEKAARILLTVIGLFGLAVFFLPKIGISVDIVMSGSMEPTLKTGGIVFTDTKRTEPSVGDIVTFRNAQGKVSHRVVAKQKQSYITKGDANNMTTEYADADTVESSVFLLYRKRDAYEKISAGQASAI